MKRSILPLFYIVLLGTIIIVTSACGGKVETGKNPGTNPPNIVLIYVDDLGYKDLECYGNEFFETPHIDDLMSTGLMFTQAYSCAPLCAPSRIALLTGRHCARAGCYEVTGGGWNEVNWFLNVEKMDSSDINADWEEHVNFSAPPNRLNLPEGRKIIPEYLKELGYATAFFGKWHMGPQKPSDRGFDDAVSFAGAHVDVTKRQVNRPDGYPEPQGNSGEYMTQVALHFAEKTADKPFFMYVAHSLIHTPLEATDAMREKYEAKPPSHHHSHPVYASMVEMLDVSTGALIRGLEERGLLDNTLIFLTSDNGGMTGPVMAQSDLDGYQQGEYTSHYPLRGGKVQLWEGGIRVPFGVIFGKEVNKGIFDGLATQMDILPTILDYAGHPDFEAVKHEFDGKSLRSILKDPKEKWEERSLFWHYPGYRGMTFRPKKKGQGAGFNQRPETVVRRGDWKLKESLETGEVQLYNLRRDISETTNVADLNPDIVESLKAELNAWREETGAPMPIPK